MASTRTVNRSFAGGELGPDMFGRIDDQKYQSGAALARNFITMPQGPAQNRAGFAYVNATKNNGPARLIPFVYSADQTMVIELGDHYARFHTQGETLQYAPSDLKPWVPPSGAISYTLTTPAVITWTAHGLATGDPVRFYVFGGSSPNPLPVGLELGYTYTVEVIDANSFRLRDQSGALVGWSAPPGGSTTYTNYPGTGSPTVHISVPPNGTQNSSSPAISGGLPNLAVAGGSVNLKASFYTEAYAYQGGGAGMLQYSTDGGSSWTTIGGSSTTQTQNLVVSISLANLNQLLLRTSANGSAGPAGSVSITATLNSGWSVDVPSGGSGAPTAALQAYRYYTAGDAVTYGPLNLLNNPTFDSGDGSGWSYDPGWAISPGSPYAAGYAAFFTGPGDGAIWNNAQIPCTPGETIYATCQALGEIGATGTAALRIAFYDSSGTQVGSFFYSPSVPNTYVWTAMSVSQAAPAGATYAEIGFVVAYQTAATPHWFCTQFTGGNNRSSQPWISVKTDSGGINTPGTNLGIWAPLPPDLIYEIPTPYAEEDLFSIHYVQSNDVITLVHPLYPPAELRRLGPTTWTLTNINFAPAISPPANVTAVASPGYKVKIASISGTLITTTTNHTLSLGDEIYIDNLVANTGGDKSGFYIVSEVPVNTSGALILNELKAMDYNGVALDATSWSGYTGSPTIQLATKSFDPTSHYVVTAIAANGVDESEISSSVSVLNNLDVPGAFNTISWDAVPGTLHYYVYKKRNSLYGYIGETTDLTFVDDNIAPDFSITPPSYESLFAGPGDYPGAVGYAEQRKVFAGTINKPQNLWMSNSGTEDTFSYSLPIKDTDRIAIAIASREANLIRHIVPLTQLLLLTSSAEIAVQPANSDVITPTTISAKPQSYVGASYVQPSVVNSALVYCASRGGHVRELGYSWEANGFRTGDLSLRAAHLFDNFTILDMCYQKAPRPILWFVSSNGNLLGLTFVPEEQIGAWHHHDTLGIFESVTCVAEGGEDRLYAVIQREINGNAVRYIERMASRILTDQAHAFFVDAGTTYEGSPATTISGLTWLEGETVSVLADGAVYENEVVTGGAIQLEHPATVVTVGLPYLSDLATLPPVIQVDGFGQGRMLNINRLWMRIFESSGIWVGPDQDHLTLYKQRTTEPWGSPPALVTGEVGPIVLTPQWGDGTVFIRQKDPLPLTVVSLTMELSVGG